eukprot:PITA_07649
MDVSYDCELNLSINFEPTSFKEAASHDEWKEKMQKEFDALIKNGTWKLVDPPFGTKPIGYKWVYKNKYKECYEEAVQVKTRKKWEQAMKEGMDSLAHNWTWDLVRLPARKTTLQNKWVYKLKEEDQGRKRYKARLVVKGFAQKKGYRI